jgi:hypothetical protein
LASIGFTPSLHRRPALAKSISGWLVSIFGLSGEYEELFMGVCFIAIAVIVYWILMRLSDRYEKWKEARDRL